MLDNIATGIANEKRTNFLTLEVLVKYAKKAPRAINDMSDLSPLHGLPITRLPAEVLMLNPSLRTETPRKLTIVTPALAAINFIGNDIAVRIARGRGNIKIKKASGNFISLVILFPKRKSEEPMIKKNMEEPDIENT